MLGSNLIRDNQQQIALNNVPEGAAICVAHLSLNANIDAFSSFFAHALKTHIIDRAKRYLF